MTRRHLFLIGTTVVWIVALAIVVKIALDRLPAPAWGNPVGDDLSPEVAGSRRVGQRFTAPLPGLYRIEVWLARATASSPHPITLHLKTDPAASEDLWSASLNAGDVQDGVPYAFEFEPIRNSKGRSFYFYFESTNSVPGDAISIRYSPTADLDGASAYLDDRPAVGNLQFRTLYSLRTREKADLLLSQMAEGKPYFLGTKGFYVGLAIVYALIVSVFTLKIAGFILGEQEKES